MMNKQSSALSPLPVLAQVTAPLSRAAPQLVAITHVADLISDFLDGSTLLTPPQAAALNSTWLLDRVITRVINDPSVDDAFRSNWLARAMKVAIEKNSLALVQLIHRAHPESLHVRSLQLALQHGTLEMALWIVENRSDRLCSTPGIENICLTCLLANLPTSISSHDTEAMLDWLVGMGVPVPRFDRIFKVNWTSTSEAKNIKMAQWLFDQGRLDPTNFLADVLSSGPLDALDMFESLIQQGHTISDDRLLASLVQGACRRELEPLIDFVVASWLCDSVRDKFVWAPTRDGGAKVLQWDADFMRETLIDGTTPMAQKIAVHAASFCHVDTLKWLFNEHRVTPPREARRKPSTQEDLLALYEWMDSSGIDGWCQDDTSCAVSKGYLPVIQWLHQHKPNFVTDGAADLAVISGHFEIVRWLLSEGYERPSDFALYYATRSGYLSMIQWLATKISFGQNNTNKNLFTAAQYGQLELLEWLSTHGDGACSGCVLRGVFNPGVYSTVPDLDGIRWLTAHATPRVGCAGRCLPNQTRLDTRVRTLPALALCNGDLAVAQYMLDHHHSSFAVDPQRLVMASGHLPAIEWLREATSKTVGHVGAR